MAGDAKNISIKGRIFAVVSDNDPGIQPGGRAPKERKMNGDGTGVLVMSNYSGMLDGVEVRLISARGDLLFLQEIQKSGEEVDVTYVASGDAGADEVWSCQGNIIEPVSKKPQSDSCVLKISASGELEQQ